MGKARENQLARSEVVKLLYGYHRSIAILKGGPEGCPHILIQRDEGCRRCILLATQGVLFLCNPNCNENCQSGDTVSKVVYTGMPSIIQSIL